MIMHLSILNKLRIYDIDPNLFWTVITKLGNYRIKYYIRVRKLDSNSIPYMQSQLTILNARAQKLGINNTVLLNKVVSMSA